LHNTLTVNSTVGGPQVFTATSLLFPVTNGDQSFNQAAQFTATTGLITSLMFSSTQNAFEASRFTINAVPEPESYALMLAGLGLWDLLHVAVNPAKRHCCLKNLASAGFLFCAAYCIMLR